MTAQVKSPRKLIEVALPLDSINVAAAKEKSIRHGHPSTLHLWWARRPLAAARAVIFAQLVNDPGFQQGSGFKYGMNKKDAAEERKRLFKIMKDLVLWENTTDETVLEKARKEIRRSWLEICELNKNHPQANELFNPKSLPSLHDPFAGGGAIPLEAQRLGLVAYASDLNPVAVLINKAMIEIPPKFSGRSPIGPLPREEKQKTMSRSWPGATGLAEDLRRYGVWMQEVAKTRIGALYPPVEITPEVVVEQEDLKPFLGKKLTVISWLWVRTVKSPNPAFPDVDVPLAPTFVLSTKPGNEVYVEPVITDQNYHFVVRQGVPPEAAEKGTKAGGKGSSFYCLLSQSPISGDYIKTEAQAGRMGVRLLAIVADSPNGRVFISPNSFHEKLSQKAIPAWKPETVLVGKCRDQVPLYGMEKFCDLFSPRQLVALSTLSNLISEVKVQICNDAKSAGLMDDKIALRAGGSSVTAYAEAICLLLGLAISRLANSINSLTVWSQSREQSVNLFSRQAIPMTWDFPEVNPFSGAAGDFGVTTTSMARSIQNVVSERVPAFCQQEDAKEQKTTNGKIVSTDPPYYDNICYADLSDFFYVWLRHTLRDIYPDLLATMAAPKNDELVASPHRHDSKEKAEAYFLAGMTQAMNCLATQSHPAFPITIYYAFKQTETNNETGTSSAGWESFLEAVFRAGLQLTGTWPMRTERPTGVKVKTNSLASCVVLSCRKRLEKAPTISRREFIRELNSILPEALDEMTKGISDDISPVAPVDLSQAIIGPGMAVFSQYAAVLEADGSPMTVRTALQIINRFLAEDDFDADTQFCLHWFEQNGWNEGIFGQADVLARAKATSVDGLAAAGVVSSGAGKVRLMRWSEYPSDWNPKTDKRCPIWEALHQLIRSLKNDGEGQAGRLLAEMSSKAEPIRQLAYRLYTLCERRGWAEDARAYNELITSWSGIEAASVPLGKTPEQMTFDEIDEGIKS